MPLIKSGKKAAVNKNTAKLIGEGYPPKQAYAIAKDVQRKAQGEEVMPWVRFFGMQLFCVLGWLMSAMSVTFALYSKEDGQLLMVLQGWVDYDPVEFNV